jgi:hypothetical protein
LRTRSGFADEVLDVHDGFGKVLVTAEVWASRLKGNNVTELALTSEKS